MRPGFWYRDAGLLAQALRPLCPFWPRPAPETLPQDMVAVLAPLCDPFTAALALVHLAQSLPGPIAALRPQPAGLFDSAGFLGDFLPLIDQPDNRTCLAQVSWPCPARARVLVVDARIGFGNGLTRPAGPLHWPVRALLDWADLLLLIGRPEHRRRFVEGRRTALPPLSEAEIAPLAMGMNWSGSAVLAFSSGDFAPMLFAACRDAGADLRGAIALPRGTIPEPAVMRRLMTDARRLGAQLVTTEADAQHLPPEIRRQCLAMPLRLRSVNGAGPGLATLRDSLSAPQK